VTRVKASCSDIVGWLACTCTTVKFRMGDEKAREERYIFVRDDGRIAKSWTGQI